MIPFIANTDRRWFDYLSTRTEEGRVDEVNFWLPKSTRPMKKMTPGEPIFFRLKKPDYEVRVSGALRNTWKNGKRYYAFDGKPLRRKPDTPEHFPSRDALAWHGEHCFQGA